MFKLSILSYRIARKRIGITMLLLCQLLMLSSCFTGIENTKPIELTRKDKKQLVRTPEETFLSDLEGRVLTSWREGDRFLVVDSKIALIFENAPGLSLEDPSLVGKHLTYLGRDLRLKPDRSEETVLLFRDSISTYRFPTGMTPQKADSATISTRLPMLVDLETIGEIKERLLNKTLWTRTQLWYDVDGTRHDGRKYVPVTIVDLQPGSSLFPIKIIFDDEKGERCMMWMNYGSSTADSRKFPVLFSLSDRRSEYPSVSDENWERIRCGEIAVGMTKLECRLALGNPLDVVSGHTHSETLDIWQYSDGTWLRFADGELVEFRR